VIVVPLKATVARIAIAMLGASPSLVPAMPRLTSPPTASVAKTEKLARAALMVIVAPRKVTVERTAIVVQDVRLLLVSARLTRAASQLTVVAEVSTEKLARAAHSATAVPLAAGVATRRITVTQAVSPSSVPVTVKPATSRPMASAVRTARLAREAHMVIVVPLRATVARPITAMQVVRVTLVLATLAPAVFLLMEAVGRMERLVRAAYSETAALSMDIVERVTISAAPAVRRPLDSAPAYRPTLSVVPGTARLVLDLVSEIAALRMDFVEAPLLIVVRAGKSLCFLDGITPVLTLLSPLQPKGCF
jgi:hypothetical protein